MNRTLRVALVFLTAGYATAATPTNQIDALTKRLNDDKMGFWVNGGFPLIPLSSNATPSAALVESDLGMKVLLFQYLGQKAGWWTRFFDVKDAEPNRVPVDTARPLADPQH